ncbi:MAG: GGDEF domain-containing protein [Clostridia bacterium]|nr:GGDEF domain-containing protein [Clostridia bacterium]
MNYWIICDLPIMCLAINIYLLISIIINKDDEQEMIVLKRVLFFAAFFIAFDCMLSLLEVGPLNLPYSVIYIINILYNIAGSGLALSFFRYSQIVFGVETIGGRKKRRIVSKKLQLMGACMSIYALAVAVFDAFAYKTDWFLIRKSGSFDYGPLDILWYVSVYLPMVVSLVFGIKLFFDKKHHSSREKYLPIIIFGLLIAIMAVIQLTVNDSYPIIPMGITMALVFMFITISEAKISRDELTRIDNRRQLYRDMESLIERGKKVSWYLLMMDGDEFKSINDGYGHSEGDRALIKIADILKVSCRKQDARIYRFGGDEFVVLKETSGQTREECDREVEEFCQRIRNRFNEYNASSGKMYKLMVSIGYAKYGEVENDSARALINRADKELYKAKGYDKR